MSRGPGKLQRSILRELSKEPAGCLLWRRLKQRYPHEVRERSFYRAIRSLRRMGRIVDYGVDEASHLGGSCHYVAIVPVYDVGGRRRFVYEADRELAALADRTRRQLRTIATARGVRPGSSRSGSSDETGVDAYWRETFLSD